MRTVRSMEKKYLIPALELVEANGCSEVTWLFPDETGFYQPIVVAKKAAVRLARCTEADREPVWNMQKEAFAALLETYQDHDTNPANESLQRITWKLQQPDRQAEGDQ